MDFSAKLLSIVLHPLLMPLYTVLLALELDPHLGYFLQAERRWLTVGMLALMTVAFPITSALLLMRWRNCSIRFCASARKISASANFMGTPPK